MKCCCPSCGYSASLTAFAGEADARECLALALHFPAPLADALLRYLQLFRPRQRALGWGRALKLLRTLHADMGRGHIQRKGRTWAAPRPAWEPALRTVVGKRDELDLPLKDHAYLYEILRRQANSTEAKAEQKVETQRRAKREPTPRPRSKQPVERGPLPAGGIMAAAQRWANEHLTEDAKNEDTTQ